MALYRETADGFSLWSGEAIEDILHPLSIEQHWNADDLAAIGLYRPVPDVIASGAIILSARVERVDGVVRMIYTFGEPVEPSVYFAPLTRRRLRLALLSIGIFSADIEAAIAAIIDPSERAAAQIEWEDASEYERDHPLLVDIAATFGLPPVQVDALWLWATGL